jgi:hypothetical protein
MPEDERGQNDILNYRKVMSDSKTYIFGEQGNSSLNALLPFLQQKGIDPAYVAGLVNNNGGGFFGNNAWEGIIALIVVAAIFGNGNGNGLFGGGNNSNSAEREMLMSAIQRNGTDLSQLAQSIGCSTGRLQDAIGEVSTQICNFAGQSGLSFQQVINSIQSGNAALASQLCNCCCDIRQAVSESNYLTERGFCNTNQILAKGFSDLGYAFANQTCDLKQTANANTASIIAKLDAIEDSRKDRELAEKDRMIATLTARSERQAELQPIYNALSDIQCNQPPVKKIACPETYVPVNNSINATYGLIPTYGCGCGYGYPFGFVNGFNNAF